MISPTAFHWIDPDVGYRKAAEVLKPDGTLALFWNKPVQTQFSSNLVQSMQKVYQREVPEMAKHFPGLVLPDDVKTPIKNEIDSSKLFEKVKVLNYSWKAEYTSTDYFRLVNTYSDHLALKQEACEMLFKGITELIETRFGGHIVREYLSILYIAHRNQY